MVEIIQIYSKYLIWPDLRESPLSIIDLFYKLVSIIRKLAGRSWNPHFDMSAAEIRFTQELLNGATYSGELEKLFYSHKGRLVRKWTHYIGYYERHFARFRSSPVRFLEIGVFEGGSLELWRSYFGEDAAIYGVDINPACVDLAAPPNVIRIGSQADKTFMASVVNEMGGIDIVLDDGSHIAKHQRASLQILWPLLSEGGLYVIEDAHTSYWAGEYEGGYGRKGTAIDIAKSLLDDMHGWYHARGHKFVPRHTILGIHVYDSMIFIEKGNKEAPKHVAIGGLSNAS